MMFPSRKDSETENKIDILINGQHELREVIEPLQANIERHLDEQLHLVQSTFQQELKTQVDWLSNALKGIYAETINELHQQKTELLHAQEQERGEQQAQIVALRSELTVQIATLHGQNVELQAQLAEWREASAFEMQPETPEALAGWRDLIHEELRTFGACNGMVRLLAARLWGHFNALCALETQIEGGASDFGTRLEELELTLFAPDIGVSWNSLTPLNSNTEQRRVLRQLESALGEFRSYLKERLRQRTGIAPLEIVPQETRFDARVHESSEFLEVPTPEPARHNLILAIERPGYERVLPDGRRELLQSARVRRSVLSNKTPGGVMADDTASGEAATSSFGETAPTTAPSEETATLPLAPADVIQTLETEMDSGPPLNAPDSISQVPSAPATGDEPRVVSGQL